MLAIILAGGEGTRLRSLTLARPKSVVTGGFCRVGAHIMLDRLALGAAAAVTGYSRKHRSDPDG